MLWVLRRKTAIWTGIVIVLGLCVLAAIGIWGWGVLVGYVEPKDSTGRKDVVQIFAVIAAGVIALIGGIVGIANLFVARRNLQQQRDLEQGRAEEGGMRAYFEQMGDLLTDHNLLDTDRAAIRRLAGAQTLTVLPRLDGYRKGSVVTFLYGTGLIKRQDGRETIVNLYRADLTHTFLLRTDLGNVDLGGAILTDSYLMASNLAGANLSDSILYDANLSHVPLTLADLSGAIVTEEQLATCESLEDATMPDGEKYEAWRKSRPNFKREEPPAS
jgi:hypothetical protein